MVKKKYIYINLQTKAFLKNKNKRQNNPEHDSKEWFYSRMQRLFLKKATAPKPGVSLRRRRAPAAHLQDGHGLGEMVLLHGGRGVERGQRVVELLQVAVAEAAVVQVMAQTCDEQAFALKKQHSTQTFKTEQRDSHADFCH